jgi:hypothetical protein
MLYKKKYSLTAVSQVFFAVKVYIFFIQYEYFFHLFHVPVAGSEEHKKNSPQWLRLMH